MSGIKWLVVFSVAAFASWAQAPVGLTGRWRSAETSTGGLGVMFEFRSDGTLSFSIGAVVEMKYRIEGNQLIFPPGSTKGPEQHQTMQWVDADHLLLNGSETLSRQGAPHDPADPILGEWTAPREIAGVRSEVRFVFEPGGKSLLLFPFKWQKGRYLVKGSTIRIEYPDAYGPPVEGPFHVEGELLTIPSSGKAGESQLRRY